MPSSALRILAFDTASTRGSIALLQGQDVLAELKLHSIPAHSTNLLHSIEFLLGRLGWSLRDLNLVAAGIGPGSFTGIRIGVATALGIAQSLSIAFAGVTGLEALARQAAFLDGRIGVSLSAQRSQAFYAEYISRSGRMRLARKPSLIFLSDLEAYLGNRHLYIVGDFDVRPAEDSNSVKAGWPRRVAVDLYLAPSIGRSAYLKKRGLRSRAYVSCNPLYIRPPDALRRKSRTW